MSKKPVVLVIRDGWGRNPLGPSVAKEYGDATVLAKTPFTDELLKTYPHSMLGASGSAVGLPEGQMGNSEVGHLNLGAGRVVFQDLCRISNAIADGSLAANATLKTAFTQAKTSRLHLMGLVSDGGVHSHIDHLIGLVKYAYEAGVRDICIHAITDGRDTSPTSGVGYMKQLEDAIAPYGAKIITVIGRFYAMDRDKRMDRNKLAWDAIVLGRGEQCTCTPHEYIESRYAEKEMDEFLKPGIFAYGNEQRVRDEDVVLFFNFRADRARQMSEAFLYPSFDGFEREVQPKIHYVTLTEYDAKYPSPVIFASEELTHIMGEIIAEANMTQLRIAETEKYAHVTFFFNGGVETQFPGEDRILVPSPREVATYDLKPQMSAEGVAEKFVEAIEKYDVAILNFANPDMVGHTGFVEAGIKACETVDHSLKLVVDRVLALGGKLLITADHGNCEHMRNADGSPNTAHTINLVDLIYVGADKDDVILNDGILADIAPTMLALLGLARPEEMSGHNLLASKK
ncbi:MAG: 2,3-bisphosphoglycerate-independent phosphoglycerate mutase [Akkermansia sp.]